MTGDLPDIVSRLQAVLPKRWFAENSPNLTGILQSIASPWVWLYDTVSYVISQTRLGTATDEWLDLISYDYFGNWNSRSFNELDFNYRTRIKAALLCEAATRSAVSSGLTALTGNPPIIFEPANCMDAGSYGQSSAGSPGLGTGLAYGVAGGWGSLVLPRQFFVRTHRPPTLGISMLAGYCTSNGAYGEGTISYVDLSLLPGHVTDQDIRTTLTRLLPVNAIAWLQIY